MEQDNAETVHHVSPCKAVMVEEDKSKNDVNREGLGSCTLTHTIKGVFGDGG